MSNFHKSGIGSFSEELQALIDYGHDCCARIDDKIHEHCERIREAHDEEVGVYQIALMWKKEQDANAMDAGGSVSAGCSGDVHAAAERVHNCAGDQLAKGVAPITTELREYVQSWRETPNLMDELDAGDIDGLLGDFIAIADRIDIAHKHAIGYVDDREPETMAENGWVKLPVDADGVPIHVGDVLEANKGTVTCIREAGHGWEIVTDHMYSYNPADLRHHKPTVEDVLRKFAEKITDSQIPGVHPTYEEAIAEYAAKLRLTDGKEQ